MHPLDIIVLVGTLGFIIVYGTIKNLGQKSMKNYLRGGDQKRWWAICISIMATQASAITFISTPGQAYESGLGFVQIYLGLPLAMIVISAVFVPIFYKLKVYTAYEYLEGRFDVATRQLVAFLFLISRGLGAGITIYAPAIILSTILGWNLSLLCALIGAAVVLYIYVGGEKAVSQTQELQMMVILGGMAVALAMLIHYLPSGVSLYKATYMAGKMGKMTAIDTHFDLDNRYTLWSGLIGGFFLSLSYFGTDQSQVSRYLGGTSVNESKLGLFFNGIVKIPMQFFILFVGVMTYVFFMFNHSPVFFNKKALEKVNLSVSVKQQLDSLEQQHITLEGARKQAAISFLQSKGTQQEANDLQQLTSLQKKDSTIRAEVKSVIKKNAPEVETNDTDYVFLSFVMNNLPEGLVGLLLAVMFCAAMSSTSGQISSLASTTVIDFYKRSVNKTGTDLHYVRATQVSTLLWGTLTVLFAVSASLVDNLVQFVNILGSLFYGTILGVFLVAFFFKRVKGRATFWAAFITELIIISFYILTRMGILSISYLWYNLIGAALVIVIGLLLNPFIGGKSAPATN